MEEFATKNEIEIKIEEGRKIAAECEVSYDLDISLDEFY